jgi:hypothetical protein
MGLFDIFTQAPAQAPAPGAAPAAPAAPAPTPANPGNIPNPTGAVTAQTPGMEANGTVPAAAPADNSPMAEFSTLWDTAPTDPNAAPAPAAPTALTAESIQQVVAKANFAGSVTPEVMAAISEGGEGAQAAFVAAINSAAQQAVTQSIMASNKLNEKAMADALAAHQAKLPDLLRKQADSDHMKTANPLFDNPAVKPVIEATQQQLRLKYPNATPAELTDMTTNYINAMGQAFAPPAPTVNDNGAGETDWSVFMQTPTQ